MPIGEISIETAHQTTLLGDAPPDFNVDDRVLQNSQERRVSPGEFELLRVLGQGSFGKVFLVRKRSGLDAGHLYAMKVIKKASLQSRDRLRAKMERNILADAGHPFIVQLHYAFQTDGKLYLVMEFLRGGDLFTRLSREIMFTEEDVKFYLAELALALGHLHSRGIVYRDLKPENILLDDEGHVKLTDFGLSKELAAYDEESRTYSFCGTVEYMAPEVVNRKGHDTASDWWSYGVLMYELLTGGLPFQGDTRQDTMQQILRAKLAMPQMLSPEAQRLLRALFKRNPAHRLGSGPQGLQQVQSHEFFACVDWQQLQLRLARPPFAPSVAGRQDAAFHFDAEFTTTTPRDSPACQQPLADFAFSDFSFVSPLLAAEAEVAAELAAVPGVRTDNFHEEYCLREQLAAGSSGVCHRCVHLATGQHCAVKIMDCSQHNPTREVSILLEVTEHPNIVSVREVFVSLDTRQVFLVTELLSGGELLQKICRQKFFSEREASAVLQVILRAVSFLHSRSVVHRDLKPDNLLYASSDGSPDSLKLCDFGFAQRLQAGGQASTPCYTAPFAAPEVLRLQAHSAACDLWSCGALLHTMLAGRSPFAEGPGDSPREILQRIESGGLQLSSGMWQSVSPAAKDLLLQLLTPNPDERISADAALEHPWISRRAVLPLFRLAAKPESLPGTQRPLPAASGGRLGQLQSVSASDLARRRGRRRSSRKSTAV